MHKKLEAELISLAHQILQLKNKDDVKKLRDKAKDVYEKLSVLAFVDDYFLTTINPTENKEEVLETFANKTPIKTTVKIKEEVAKEEIEEVTKSKEEILETPKKEIKTVPKKEPIVTAKPEIASKKEETVKEDVKMPNLLDGLDNKTQATLKAEADAIIKNILEKKPETDKSVLPKNSLANNTEFKDTIPADVAANLFEKAKNLGQLKGTEKSIEPTKKETIKPNVAVKVTQKQQYVKPQKTSLNDKLFKNKLQIGLNDRIAFVKHLFNYSQEEFNRVLSQLNTFETELDAKQFITQNVKPDYNWLGKEEYEERLIELIERKFL